MAKKKRKYSKARRARRSHRHARRAAKSSACCPVIQVKCKPVGPGKPKVCSVKVGSGKVRKMNSVKAGAFIGRTVRAQQKRRCRPLVKGSTS